MKALMLLAVATLLTGCATYRYQDGYYSGNVEYRSAYPAPYTTWGYDPYGPYSPYYAPTYYYSGGVRYVRHGDRDDYRRGDRDRHRDSRRHDRGHDRHHDRNDDHRSNYQPRQRKRPTVKERSYLDRNRRRVRGH